MGATQRLKTQEAKKKSPGSRKAKKAALASIALRELERAHRKKKGPIVGSGARKWLRGEADKKLAKAMKINKATRDRAKRQKESKSPKQERKKAQ